MAQAVDSGRTARQSLERTRGKVAFIAAQSVQNVDKAIAAEKRINLRLLRGQGALGRGLRCFPDRGYIAGLLQRGDEIPPHLFRDVTICKTDHNRVRGSHACARCAKVFTEPSRGLRQHQRAAHIRDKTDAAFGHGDLAAFADDPVRAVAGNADAAAHGKALHEAAM